VYSRKGAKAQRAANLKLRDTVAATSAATASAETNGPNCATKEFLFFFFLKKNVQLKRLCS